MALKIDPSQAPQFLNDIQTSSNHATQALQQVQELQQQMLVSNWQGDSAGRYGKSSSAQNDDVEQMITKLQNAVRSAEGAVRDMIAADQG
ncbi:WXG100 family type VII secretion target [Mycobacterium sp. 1465703.0]|uniref:WXG100 family type VII secretion target n=1 Tax=Mycobacterium sp. 1465703.0 TaxID=1834078 RepID=UPI0007FFAAE9|nr:WXG100 family type VII secretion target [Mycobacterium sp. 1465703.0]OBJ07368.1 hypothetical protein A5625_01650 [Mycobacterium sp. 1465703.0]